MAKFSSVGVIGGGFVGNTIGKYYSNKGLSVKVYDKFKKLDSIDDVIKQDVIFIAVPTPFNGKIDLSAMDDAMANVGKAGENKIVIIKSTIVPGTTEDYQKKYPYLNIIFNPEFLTESTADQDFAYPDRQIVGTTEKSYGIAGDVMLFLPLSPFNRIMPSKEAEMAKYFGNNWFAIKVAYANQIYDVCQKLGLDYETVKEAAAADKRVGPSHLDVLHKGYRGYGGKCLPKDIRAMIAFADELGVDLKLHRAAEDVNRELTGGEDKGLA